MTAYDVSKAPIVPDKNLVNVDVVKIPEENSDIAGDALDEFISDAQSGDFIFIAGFEPKRLADYYMGNSEEQNSNVNAQRIEELAEKLVDRILISGPNNINGQEVQLKLVNNVLQGAEVWIRRDKGELQIDFHTKTRSLNHFMIKNKESLSDDIQKRLGEKINVNIENIKEEEI